MSVTEATPHQFPFLVGLIADGISRGDGILISPDWVLTIASLLNNRSSVQLFFGAHFTDEWNSASQMAANGGNVHLHENWAPDTLANNLALIHLPTPVTLNAAVQPLTRLHHAASLTGQAATSVGWGNDIGTRAPQVVDASIIDIQEAISLYGQRYNHPGQIAVDIKGATSRTSTLITSDANGWQLIGLGNFGPSSVGSGPEIYTRIADFSYWIEQGSGVTLIS